jgi:hypothetical protein
MERMVAAAARPVAMAVRPVAMAPEVQSPWSSRPMMLCAHRAAEKHFEDYKSRK